MKKAMIFVAAGVMALTAHTASAGNITAAGSTLSTAEVPTSIVSVHDKLCKFRDKHGRKYRDHCPHGLQKGSRKKRAAIGAGAGAAAGAIIGGILGGGRGAAIGAAAGAATGAASGAASVKKCYYRDQYGRKVKVKCRQ